MYATTLTQKGQVVIPKPIRDLFNLKAFDKLIFSVVKDKIVVKPALTVDQAYGMMASNVKPVSKAKMKAYIRKRVMEKHDRSRH